MTLTSRTSDIAVLLSHSHMSLENERFDLLQGKSMTWDYSHTTIGAAEYTSIVSDIAIDFRSRKAIDRVKGRLDQASSDELSKSRLSPPMFMLTEPNRLVLQDQTKRVFPY
ncbi:predicted protein [Sclerotinia sclerotiorum 1980 UF-70]|uniref:Uncharacterized protein n=1 Tax=Sclerotinia sclerotiorum (strain ATCC 18683 / 1980 / Ss-1) TaxID=665079 RepID=A7EZL4_SCLS1|nr:predicted protein [Sclerotinia sclerotiorum 1980 UF-70]EDN94906.1 predicted protein [Sclerotinia sclerotiorum 1980 UF-70]